nr:hypothetical protein [Rhizobium sp. CG5]
MSLVAVLAGCNTDNPNAALSPGATPPAGNTPAADPSLPTPAVVQANCPSIVLRDGTASYRTYAKGGKDKPDQVVYQASLADTTRACVLSADTNLTIKVMAQGRLIGGPAGKAGTVSLPIRVVVTDGDKVLYSELTKFDATLADVSQPAQFIFVKDNVTVPSDLGGLAKVYVGFDEGPAKK